MAVDIKPCAPHPRIATVLPATSPSITVWTALPSASRKDPNRGGITLRPPKRSRFMMFMPGTVTYSAMTPTYVHLARDVVADPNQSRIHVHTDVDCLAAKLVPHNNWLVAG